MSEVYDWRDEIVTEESTVVFTDRDDCVLCGGALAPRWDADHGRVCLSCGQRQRTVFG